MFTQLKLHVWMIGLHSLFLRKSPSTSVIIPPLRWNIYSNINDWPLPRFCNQISSTPSSYPQPPNPIWLNTVHHHFSDYMKSVSAVEGGSLTHYSRMSSSSIVIPVNRCCLSQLQDNYGTLHSWDSETKSLDEKLGKQRQWGGIQGGNIDRQACYLLVFCRRQLQRRLDLTSQLCRQTLRS